MPRAKVKYKAVGTCPNCGTVFIRPPVCTHAICDCSSIIEVPLHPVLILPSRLHKKIKKIADLAGVPLGDFVNALLLEVIKEFLDEKMVLQYELRGVRKNNSLSAQEKMRGNGMVETI